jgi:hypothetical protein
VAWGTKAFRTVTYVRADYHDTTRSVGIIVAGLDSVVITLRGMKSSREREEYTNTVRAVGRSMRGQPAREL